MNLLVIIFVALTIEELLYTAMHARIISIILICISNAGEDEVWCAADSQNSQHTGRKDAYAYIYKYALHAGTTFLP